MLPIQETSYWHSESTLKVTTIRYDPWCVLQVFRYVNSTATSLQVGRPKFNALVQNGVRWPLKTRICGVAWVPSREGMFEATHILDIARNSCLPDDHYLVNWLTRDTLCRCSQHVCRSKRNWLYAVAFLKTVWALQTGGPYPRDHEKISWQKPVGLSQSRQLITQN